ncbi:hypothetical protein THAOC_18877 [Thalassiosira oceanica]|uniref:Uncharacterized protein n=1 Tax=Thalassiosira oceanica TaxID=159749 RepID=K0S675_THAOC|nr:hypothetical protein THAOC_18877 [Thalassiosira oceanica]|eukprot:EJK60720.1 hypothetical protein THAOC_18877 [Thalassiosira oceanica]
MRVKRSATSSGHGDTHRPVIGGQASLGGCSGVALPSAYQRCVMNKQMSDKEVTTTFGAPPPPNRDCKKSPVIPEIPEEAVFECPPNAGEDHGNESPKLVPEFGMQCLVRFDGGDYYAATITSVSSGIGDGDEHQRPSMRAEEDFWNITQHTSYPDADIVLKPFDTTLGEEEKDLSSELVNIGKSLRFA